jgi:hypothetical protein
MNHHHLPLADRVFANVELSKMIGGSFADPALRRLIEPTTPDERVARRMCEPLHLSRADAPSAPKPAVRKHNIVSIDQFRKV